MFTSIILDDIAREMSELFFIIITIYILCLYLQFYISFRRNNIFDMSHRIGGSLVFIVPPWILFHHGMLHEIKSNVQI